MTVWSVKTFVVSDAHVERMLYDNAQLAFVYLHAWQATGTPLFRGIVGEVLDYVMCEMAAPAGDFYAAQDALSEGGGGRFCTWTPAEIREVLGHSTIRFLELYGVTGSGNSEGRTILIFKGTLEERRALASARHKRTASGRDEKVVSLSDWANAGDLRRGGTRVGQCGLPKDCRAQCGLLAAKPTEIRRTPAARLV